MCDGIWFGFLSIRLSSWYSPNSLCSKTLQYPVMNSPPPCDDPTAAQPPLLSPPITALHSSCVRKRHTSFLPFSMEMQGCRPTPPPTGSPLLSVGLSWAKEKIKTNRSLISRPRSSLLSCRQKEPSPGRLPQIKASCSPLAASPIHITTTKPAETIIYSFWCGFWSYPPPTHTHPPSSAPPLPRPSPPALCISYSEKARPCELLRKEGFFEGAATPELSSSLLLWKAVVESGGEKLTGDVWGVGGMGCYFIIFCYRIFKWLQFSALIFIFLSDIICPKNQYNIDGNSRSLKNCTCTAVRSFYFPLVFLGSALAFWGP